MKRSQIFVTNALKPEKIDETWGTPKKLSSKTDDRPFQVFQVDCQ